MSDWPVRIMVYGAGEAIDGTLALAPQIQHQLSELAKVCTNSFVAATAQLDSSQAPTRRFVLDPSGRQPVQELPNVNVGDPQQLLDFVAWSAAICPAAQSVLVLSGHGMAWEDAAVDRVLGTGHTRSPSAPPVVPGAIHNTRSLFGANANAVDALTRAVLIDGHDRDYLSNAELGAVCQRLAGLLGGAIDVLVFDACLMSSVEILQELRGSVRTVVASIDELSAAGIDMAAAAREMTAEEGKPDGVAIASRIAGTFVPQNSFDSCVAIDLEDSRWGQGLASFRLFCTSFLTWVQADAAHARSALAALRVAATSVVQYSDGGLADIGAFAEAIAGIPGVPRECRDDIAAAAQLLGSCVLARSAGRDYSAALGLSVFAPNSATVYETNRPEYQRLQFSGLTGWGAVLEFLYGYRSDVVDLGNATVLSRSPVARTSSPPAAPGPGNTEFVVSLRGLPIDAATRARIEDVVRRVALQHLVDSGDLADVVVATLGHDPATRGLPEQGIGLPDVLGLVVRPTQLDLGLPALDLPGLDLPATRAVVPGAAPTSSTDVELRVVLAGIDLDPDVRTAVDSALRSAVLRELAAVDNLGARRIGPLRTGPPTRSVLAGPDLAGPDLAGPDLAGPDLAGPDLAGTDLAGPDLAGTDLPGSVLGVLVEPS